MNTGWPNREKVLAIGRRAGCSHRLHRRLIDTSAIGIELVKIGLIVGEYHRITCRYKPDGSQWGDQWLGDGGLNWDFNPAPVSGTYTVRVDIGLRTGSYTVTLSQPVTGSASPVSSANPQALKQGRIVFARKRS